MSKVLGTETKWNNETNIYESKEILVENNLDNEYLEKDSIPFSEEEIEELTNEDYRFLSDLNLSDIQRILSFKGKIAGKVGSCEIDDFISYIDEETIQSIVNAKGILVNFKIQNNNKPYQVFDLINEINNIAKNKEEFIFSTEYIENTTLDELIQYEIILTGL